MFPRRAVDGAPRVLPFSQALARALLADLTSCLADLTVRTLRTLRGRDTPRFSLQQNIGQLYGASLARELMAFDVEEARQSRESALFRLPYRSSAPRDPI